MARIFPSQVVRIIDQVFPRVAEQSRNPSARIVFSSTEASSLAVVIDLVEQIPEELIVLETQDYATLKASLTFIKSMIHTWVTNPNVQYIVNLPGLGDLNPMTHIRQALVKCPDEYPSQKTLELKVIQGKGAKDFRESLRIDLSATNHALSNGEWKAATVLAGSVVEALLLWALLKRKKGEITSALKKLQGLGRLKRDPGADLENWSLEPLAEVAAELKVITQETLAQVELAKNFRNLIHPGREIRLRQKCDRATALSAVAAVEHVVRDFS
jgi:hypothetical protein